QLEAIVIKAQQRARRFEHGPVVKERETKIGSLQREGSAFGSHVGGPAAGARCQAERTALDPTAHEPIDHPIPRLGRKRSRPQGLEYARRHGANLAVEMSLHAPRHVPDIALGGHLRATGPQSELIEYDPPTLRREGAARGPIVELEPLQQRRLGADPAAGRLELEGPAGAL